METPLNLLAVAVAPAFALFIIYKNFANLDLKLVGLILVVTVICVGVQVFMFNGADKFQFIEKFLLTALGFGSGLFTAGQIQPPPTSTKPPL